MNNKERYYECMNCHNFFYEEEMNTYNIDEEYNKGYKCPDCGYEICYEYVDIEEAFYEAKLVIESLNEKLRTYYDQKNTIDWLRKKLEQYEQWYKEENREIVQFKKENERLKDIINYMLKRDKKEG